MAMTMGARAKSLAFTAVGTGVTGPITSIQSYEFSSTQEVAALGLGTARVDSHWAGKQDATIKVETTDLAKWAGFAVGQKYSSVVLTIEGAIDSGGISAGDDITVTLSKAIVSEVGAISGGRDDSQPVVGSVTFQLSRHVGDSVDPTFAIAASGG